MSDEPTSDLLTVREVAAHFHVKEKTVRSWISEGRLPASKPTGKMLLIRRADMLALLGDTPAEAKEATVADGPFRETGSRVVRPEQAVVNP